ncbi:thialysine N-epsilon-acetyltransferase-like [Periplaneta americana]|uniref:thialysine N-epsilon-acetyltransferase-like n=1 Tax=Periplaneta americana TaxID=6978 RepID=UPI0037E9C3CA
MDMEMERIVIRDARREDCAEIKRLIQELADYLECHEEPELNECDLEEDGFSSEHPYFHCFVADAPPSLAADSDQHVLVGYAVYYYTYSTWKGKSIYLEDIYVMPEYRKHGLGSALFMKVAEKGYKTGCSRMDFLVQARSPAGEFYKNKGAIDMTDTEGWHHYRLCREEMEDLSNKMNGTITENACNGISKELQ